MEDMKDNEFDYEDWFMWCAKCNTTTYHKGGNSCVNCQATPISFNSLIDPQSPESFHAKID